MNEMKHFNDTAPLCTAALAAAGELEVVEC